MYCNMVQKYFYYVHSVTWFKKLNLVFVMLDILKSGTCICCLRLCQTVKDMHEILIALKLIGFVTLCC